MGLTWGQIGDQLNVSLQRAQQLYSLDKFFQRSAKSPFRDLSTRARNLLNSVAASQRWPRDWESKPELVTQMLAVLRLMPDRELSKFRQAGQRTTNELSDFLTRKMTEAFGADLADSSGKDFTVAEDPNEAIQVVTKFFNDHGFMGEFKAWPPGSFKKPDPNYSFTVTVSDFMADAWMEKWSAFQEFDGLLRSVGYDYEREGVPGSRAFNFYRLSA